LSVQIVTLGCRLNLAESEEMARLAQGEEDLVIVNSCAVTAEAVRRTRQAIRGARRERPEARIVVTGCAAQIDPAGFAGMPEVTRVISNFAKLGRAPFAPPVSSSDRTRAFVGVQTGCDHRCTFCIIPFGRGPSRSVPAGAVVERIAALVGGGVREVVLTGVDLTSYGHDLPGAPPLGSLVERILRHIPSLPRLRLSSIDSVEIDARLFELIASEARVMPHLHLSLQAGDDMVLKRMKRRHSRADAVRIVERIKARRDVAIGADLIAGFPTESEEMAANSLRLIADCQIVYGHIFRFSPREGTPAARMPQVPHAALKERAAALREAAAAQRSRWLRSLVGTRQRVLVERCGSQGHAENFATVRVQHPSQDVVDVEIAEAGGSTLTGVAA